jgi:hypothetical protein
MAKDKKTVQFYADWHETFKALDNETAGGLIKHMFSFLNDENPVSKDQLINLLFIPFKSTFERDLVKWKAMVEKRSKAGKKSAEVKKLKLDKDQYVTIQQDSTKSTSVESVGEKSTNVNTFQQTSTKSTDRDTDTDTDRDRDRDTDTEKVKKKPTKPVKKALPMPSLEEFIAHAKERKANVNPEDVRLKYFSWKDNDWSITRDNKTRPILNWKSTLTNTVKFLGVVAIEENISNLADPLTQQEANEKRLAEKKRTM